MAGVCHRSGAIRNSVTAIDTSAGSVYGNLSGFMRAECTGMYPADFRLAYSRINGYLNPAAFTSAPRSGMALALVTVALELRSSAQRNIDLAVLRNFPVKEWSILQFRAEFFNLTNTPNFGGPITNVAAGGAFGLITSTTNNPRIIQFALKYLFFQNLNRMLALSTWAYLPRTTAIN